MGSFRQGFCPYVKPSVSEEPYSLLIPYEKWDFFIFYIYWWNLLIIIMIMKYSVYVRNYGIDFIRSGRLMRWDVGFNHILIDESRLMMTGKYVRRKLLNISSEYGITEMMYEWLTEFYLMYKLLWIKNYNPTWTRWG